MAASRIITQFVLQCTNEKIIKCKYLHVCKLKYIKCQKILHLENPESEVTSIMVRCSLVRMELQQSGQCGNASGLAVNGGNPYTVKDEEKDYKIQ